MFLATVAAVFAIAAGGLSRGAQAKLKGRRAALGAGQRTPGNNQAHAEGVQIMKANLPRRRGDRVEERPEAPTPSA